MRIIISGDSGYASLLTAAQNLRSGLLNTGVITSADIQDREKPEIRIQFSLADLYQYPLQLSEVNRRLQQQSSSAVGGRLETRMAMC